MECYVRELRETNEKLRIAEAALHKKMDGRSRQSLFLVCTFVDT